MTILEVRNLYKSYGGFIVLNNISMLVEEGERIAIIGPNGAGKSTLFNIISGITKPDSGEMIYLDKSITFIPAYKRSRLGIARTFQKTNLFFSLSLEDNFRLALGTRLTLEIEELLENSGLKSKRKISVEKLSYGEQRQVELMLALIKKPKLLLLDEPTAGMSLFETEQMTILLQSLPKDISILLIEHDMSVVENIADRITVLHHGEILFEGDKKDLRHNNKLAEIYFGDNEVGDK